jgi:hypothetical protein
VLRIRSVPERQPPPIPDSTPPLNQLDRVAIRIGDPSGAQLAVEKVMGRREQSRPLGD